MSSSVVEVASCPVPGCEALLEVETKLKCGEYVTLEERNAVALSWIDYEYFEENFDLCCRFLYILANTDPEMESDNYLCLYKDLFVISCRLKCGRGSHVKQSNQNYLTKAANTLQSSLVSETIRHRLKTSNRTMAVSYLIAFALINIYSALSERTSGSRVALVSNILSSIRSDSSAFVFQIAYNFKDYHLVLDEIDRFRDSTECGRYNFEVPTNLKSLADIFMLFLFIVQLLLAGAGVLVIGEIVMNIAVDFQE